MNLLVISNMKPGKNNPVNGIFVQNQVDELRKSQRFDQLLFLGISSVKKGLPALLLKYGLLMVQLFTQAIFCRQRFDIIHVHYFYPTIWFAIIYKILRHSKVKIVVTFHGSDVHWYPNPSWFYRYASSFIDHHVFVSKGLVECYYQQLDPSKVTVLSAGILDSYKPPAKPVDKTYDLLMIGVLCHKKGPDRLLALLDELNDGLNIGIIGGGELVDMILDYRSDKHTMNYLGVCKPADVKAYLHQSKFLLNVARTEAFGLVITEALACGIPVIATSTDGATEQLTAGVNGFLLDNTETDFGKKNVVAMQHYLQQGEQQDYQVLSVNAVDSVQKYKISRVVSELGRMYQGCLS